MTESTARLSTLFRLANLAVLPGWFLMIFAPRSRWTRTITESDTFFIGMGGLYAAMLVGAIKENPHSAGNLMNPTLENIGDLLKNGGPRGTFAAWTHYLVFDFMVARTILRDSQERAIPHLQVVPGLILTLMSGPVGLAYYRILVRLRGAQ